MELYKSAIATMRNVKLANDRDFAQFERELNEDKAKADRFAKRSALVADVAFAFKGAGKTVLKYGSRQATLVVGKETLKLAPAIFDAVNPNADSTEGKLASRSLSVASDNSLLPLAGRAPNGRLVGNSVGKEVIDGAIESATKRAEAAELISGTMAEGINILTDLAVQGLSIGAKGLSLGVKGLEAINPSSIAKFSFGVIYGKTPDEIHRETQANIRKTRESIRQNIDRRILQLQKDRKTVHGV
ncbi:MAG: hypothetical protein ACI92S_005020 [Planctomycetaceae bacterium]